MKVRECPWVVFVFTKIIGAWRRWGELHGTECQSVDFVDYDEDLGSDAVIKKRQLASPFEDTP